MNKKMQMHTTTKIQTTKSQAFRKQTRNSKSDEKPEKGGSLKKKKKKKFFKQKTMDGSLVLNAAVSTTYIAQRIQQCILPA